MRRVNGEPHNTVSTVGKIKPEQLRCVVFLGLVFLLSFLILLRLGNGFVVLCDLIGQFPLFFRHPEAVVSIKIEEHNIYIFLGTPAAVAAVSGSIAAENHCFSAQCPLAIAIAVTALRKVVNLSRAGRIDQSDVTVVPTAVADIGRKQPFTIRTPLEPDVAVAVRIDIFAVHCRVNSLCFDVDHAEITAIFKEGYALSIGAELRHLRGFSRLYQLLFNDVGGVSKVFLIAVLGLCHIDLPQAAAL